MKVYGMKLSGLLLCFFIGFIQAAQVAEQRPVRAIWKAIEQKDAQKLADLLDEQCDVPLDVMNRYNKTPLMEAVLNGDFNSVMVLLQHGALLNTQDQNGSTALMFAIINDYDSIAHLLIDYGARVNAADWEGVTPLMLAIGRGRYLDLVEHLVARGASLIAQDIEDKTPLEYNVNKVSDKVSDKASVHEKFKQPESDIKERFARGIQLYELEKKMLKAIDDKDAVKILQSLFREQTLIPNVKIRNEYGSPLMVLAVKKGDPELVRFFLEQKVPAFMRDNIGYTALAYAVVKGQREIVQLLLDAGSPVDERVHQSYTPLMLAAQYGYLDMVKLLLERGASPQAVNCDGRTALMLAIEAKQEPIVTLLAPLSNINHQDKKGATALFKVVYSLLDSNVIKLLLDLGADVNLAREEITPLMAAVYKGRSDIVKLLVAHGASLEDVEGGGVIDYAPDEAELRWKKQL